MIGWSEVIFGRQEHRQTLGPVGELKRAGSLKEGDHNSSMHGLASSCLGNGHLHGQTPQCEAIATLQAYRNK
jgi:hypothetical protein